MIWSNCITGLRALLMSVLMCSALWIVLPMERAYADSLREVAERVARQHDAKVVSAREETDRSGQRVYVIRILTRDGVVRTIRVPANGQIELVATSEGWLLRWAELNGNLNQYIDQHVWPYPMNSVPCEGTGVTS